MQIAPSCQTNGPTSWPEPGKPRLQDRTVLVDVTVTHRHVSPGVVDGTHQAHAEEPTADPWAFNG